MRPPIVSQASQAAKEISTPQQPQPTRPATGRAPVNYPDSGGMVQQQTAAIAHVKQRSIERTQANAAPLTGKAALAADLQAAKQRAATAPTPAREAAPARTEQAATPQSGKQRLANMLASAKQKAADTAARPTPNPSRGR